MEAFEINKSINYLVQYFSLLLAYYDFPNFNLSLVISVLYDIPRLIFLG